MALSRAQVGPVLGPFWPHLGPSWPHLCCQTFVVRRLPTTSSVFFFWSDQCLFFAIAKIGFAIAKRQALPTTGLVLRPSSSHVALFLVLVGPLLALLGPSWLIFAHVGPPWHHLGLTLRFGRSILTRSGLHLILASLRAILAPSRSSWSFLARWHIT